jgi:CRISPR/Cas system endoribonuclease Cas6 (RAMP superfamily)
MALICRSKRYLTKPVRILLFKSLVMSHLNYYSSIYSNVAKSLISPLITMQKRQSALH